MTKCLALAGLGLVLLVGWYAGNCGPEPEAKPENRPISAQSKTHMVRIRTPAGPPTIATGQRDFHGQSIEVRCGTCHVGQTPNPRTRTAKELDQFHQGMTYAHGNITCLSCHNRDDYETLTLASGESLPYQNVMTLCSQCHGPQARDYAHGAHGGMTGYWDLTKGSRLRNNCVDCHDPHHPAYPRVAPVFGPKDRFPPVPHHE